MERKYSLSFVLVMMFTAFAITGLVLCAIFLFALRSLKPAEVINAPVDFGINELLGMISDRYIGRYDEEDLITAAKRGIVYELGDQWSYYMTAEEYAQYAVSSNNTYHGIGVEVLIDDEAGGIRVTNIYKNSGAQMAGILIGDIITAIDGVSIRGYSMNEVRSALRRELGDTAQITVLRTSGEFEDVTVIYNVIFTDPVSYEMLSGNNGGLVGYIALKNFEGSSADGFINAVISLIDEGAGAFIYDVRSNNGGRVNEMTQILDFLLPEGIIFISIDENAQEHIIYSDSNFIDLPAVVLVNSYSYSGAEYFTAALSEYGYAATVGEQTTGKNRMQSTLRLSDGSALHISTGMFLTPNRIDLYEQNGYIPDYTVELTQDELNMFYSGLLTHDIDPQIQKALELLANR